MDFEAGMVALMMAGRSSPSFDPMPSRRSRQQRHRYAHRVNAILPALPLQHTVEAVSRPARHAPVNACKKRDWMMIARRFVVLAAAGLLTGVTLARAANAQELRTVKIGVVNLSTDIAFYIAEKRGYLKQEGLKADFAYFDSGAKMIVPLGTGALDTGGGAASAGLYNAVDRGIELRVVADKGMSVAGYDYKALVVRKDFVERGAFKSLADLKGKKVAIVAQGAADESVLHQALLKGGLKDSDIDRVYVPFSQQLVALQNKGIDAAIAGEPDITQMLRMNVASRFAGLSSFYAHEAAQVLYSGKFSQDRQTGARFLTAYLRAVRDYDRALKDGKLAGPGSEEIIQMLGEMTGIKDLSIFRDAVPPYMDPNGALNMTTLQTDLDYFKELGLVKKEMILARVIDPSFAEAAAAALGPRAK
jgi:NitT/TauT family transport system substrate-binding protein